jgi:hypothetical protein
MPRVRRRNKYAKRYTDHERDVLLCGVPVSAASTRFGHPKSGWNLEEFRTAWSELREELAERWLERRYDVYRVRYGMPFAEWLLARPDSEALQS